MQKSPSGREGVVSDAELRFEVEAGLNASAIARKFGVSRQAISKRVNRLGLTTTAAAVAPEESRRFVRRQIEAMQELIQSLSRVKLLMDACDEWLRDPENPEKYDVGARSEEITVHYTEMNDEGREVRTKAPLSTLLRMVMGAGVAVGRVESRHADPRQLILSTAQEVRQTVSTAAELARMLADARAMEVFRDAVLTEIAQVDREIAGRIEDRVRRSLVLYTALGEPGEMAAAGTGTGE